MKDRIIHTGLYGDRAYDIINAMHGNLSDGMFENRPSYEKYWLNFDVQRTDDGEVVFALNGDYNTFWCQKYIMNPFRHMDDNEVKKWMAQKIKAVMCRELKDEGLFRAWNRRNTDFMSSYLNHELDITVADVYCVYDALLNRPVGITKYEVSTMCRVFGNKKSDEDVAKAKNLRESIDAIKEKYNNLKKIEAERITAEINKLNQDLIDMKHKLYEQEQKEINQVKAEANK